MIDRKEIAKYIKEAISEPYAYEEFEKFHKGKIAALEELLIRFKL